jgi:hypothetical protein
MSFSHPAAWWLMALGLPIALAHFYRGRVRRILVPTLLFWEQLVVEEERRSALKRLRKLISLLLVLGALAALSSAVADPTRWGPEPRRVAIFLDTGPAMRAGGRLDEARARARDLLSRLGRNDEAALVDAAGLVEPMTGDIDRVAGALARLPRDIAPKRDALDSARRLPGELFVFSCTAGPRTVPVGTPLPNLSVARPALSADPGSPSRTVTVTVTNHSDAAVEPEIVLRDRGAEAARRRLPLGPRASAPVAFPLDAKRGALVEVALAAHDAFAGDDVAALVLPPSAPPAVALVGDAGAHLLAVLEVLHAEGEIVLHRVDSVAKARGAAVVVLDGGEAPESEDGGWLVLRAKGTHDVLSPRIASWIREAPFHARVDYADVRITRASILEGRALVSSDKGPIATWDSRMGRALLRFGFSFRDVDTDLVLRTAFPLLVRGAIAWLAGEGQRAFPPEASVGATFANRRPVGLERGQAVVTHVVGEAGRTRVVPVDDSIVRIPIGEPGLLKIEVGPRSEWVAANDPAAGSIDLTAVATGAGPEFPPAIPWWRDLPYAAVAAIAAALLLLAEWWVFQTLG